MNRRSFLCQSSCGALGALLAGARPFGETTASATRKRPNILFALADDWSWPYASMADGKGPRTPNFDRVAREGVLFTHAYCAAPQCSPNRAAMLTGHHIWQIEEAGTHSSLFPDTYPVYPELLEGAGYHVGFTGKGWGPGNWLASGRKCNPAGQEYNRRRFAEVPLKGINRTDYAGNFEDFLAAREGDAPFCFWYGGHEPHRTYQEGAGLADGRKLEDVLVPAFLPDCAEVRGDILDHFLEIEWFDEQLGRMMQQLETRGELDNTMVVVTGDNGMAFPRAKANLYEYGVRVPLAIRWGAKGVSGRVLDDLVSFVDFAPTFLEVAGITPPEAMSGQSFLKTLTDGAPGRNEYVLFGRERHTHARPDNLGYPARAIRTRSHLYIRNLKPDRWPAGDPDTYADIDDGPTKTYMLENQESQPELFALAFGKRPEEELFDVRESMDCMDNLAEKAEHAAIKEELGAKLTVLLTEQGDPRMLGTGDVFESYPRFGKMRPELGGFAEQGVPNPRYQGNQR